jgi:tRNA1Val (adenine37-N6)-methyltransferase
MKSSSFHDIAIRPEECIDSLMGGRLKLIQSRDGYRFSIDALLLSGFITVRPGDVVVELGTGCGVILMLLLLTKPVGHAFGLEIQEELTTQAARNALLNGFEDKMEVVRGDIKHLPLAAQSADIVICNPPYRQVSTGRLNPDPRRAIARHEILASIDDILHAAKGLLRKRGRLAVIYPALRLVDILMRMRGYGLEPKKVQIAYPSVESSAKLALIEAWVGGRPGLEICPPVVGQGNFQA